MSWRRTLRGSLLALLVVTAGVSSIVAVPAGADTYTDTITDGSVDHVIITTSGGTDAAQIEIAGIFTNSNGQEVKHFLRRTTVNKDNDHYLAVYGAYDSYEVKVTTQQSTTTVQISGGNVGPGSNVIGDVGGDTNLRCGAGEKAASLFGTHYTDCNPVPDESINVSNLTATEVETDVYASAKTDKERVENYNTTIYNRIEDSRSVALIKGKNAYIRALNNGSSKTAAKAEAVDAVRDFYSRQQKSLIDSYNDTAYHVSYLHSRLENEPNTSPDAATTVTKDGQSNYYGQSGVSSRSITLNNGTSQAYVAPKLGFQVYIDGSTDYIYEIDAPTSDYSQFTYLTDETYDKNWNKIKTESDIVVSELDTFVDNTYSEYQEGEITNEELIDPYVAQRQYGPEGDNFSTWAVTSLTLLGTNSPAALDTTGSFEVSDATTNETYTGILLSDENPASGGFSAGTTYDATALNGSQYVVTDTDVQELTGNFTVESITTKNGTSVDSADFRTINYSTTNTTEYAETLDQLATTQAQLDALQAELAATGGGTSSGGGLPDQILGAPLWAVLVAAAAGVILLTN